MKIGWKRKVIYALLAVMGTFIAATTYLNYAYYDYFHQCVASDEQAKAFNYDWAKIKKMTGCNMKIDPKELRIDDKK